MSADNGVYILKSPRVNTEGKIDVTLGFEHRVLHAQCIENIQDEELGKYYEALMFYDAKVLSTIGEALNEAQRIYDDLMEDAGICEYGICPITMEHPFPDIKREEAKEKIDKYWEEFQKTRLKGEK